MVHDGPLPMYARWGDPSARGFLAPCGVLSGYPARSCQLSGGVWCLLGVFSGKNGVYILTANRVSRLRLSVSVCFVRGLQVAAWFSRAEGSPTRAHV